MANKEELEIHVLPNGQVKVDVFGQKGKSCESYLELFQAILGKVSKRDVKPEYYEPEPKTRIDIEKRDY